MKNNYKKIIIFCFLFLIPLSFINGQVKPPSDLYPCNGPDCDFDSVILLVKGIFSRLIKYAFIISPILIAYAGGLYIIDGNKPGSRSKANTILKSIVIGLGVMILSWTIISLFLKIFANDRVIELSPINPNKP